MRILIYGDAPVSDTGFATVTKNLAKYWQKAGHTVSIMGLNYYGFPYSREQFPYDIWPAEPGSLDNIYAYAKVWYVARQFKPDIIFIINDPWIIDKALQFKPNEEFLNYVKIVGYYPTDGGPIKPEWVETLNGLDAQVCYSNYAERVVIESNGNKRPDNLYQIYHGVDTDSFYPVNQSLARQKLGLPLKSFIVGMVARNQYRKRFDLLMKSFADFAEDKPEAKLYLHTALKDVGFDITDLAQQFKIDNKLIMTEDLTAAKGVSVPMLNTIYNTFDVNTLISLGDGFGLPVAESMATGVPQIVSDHSCLSELVSGHGGLTVKNAAWIMNTNGINTWGAITDTDDLTKKLNILYKDKTLRLKLAEEGYDFIRQDQFNWEIISKRFITIFKEKLHILEVENAVA